ncbi:MAG TPA: hypothetical protein VI934_04395 [Candidatus Nanoarchaeia archaeon]|nr:hypothetical protein [Candidatus Nanoarchaeia archaeon]
MEERALSVVNLFIFLSLLAGVLAATLVSGANPNAPATITVNQSSNRSQTLDSGIVVPAQAGNVTQLVINDTRTTLHWQGYYGRVTGRIALDDARNMTLFDWQLASPVGRIFASNTSTVSWSNITCVNFTSNISDSGTRSKLNNSILEDHFNITHTEVDAINQTFNYTFSGSFTVGNTIINTGYNCPLVYTYVSNLPQQSTFKEVLLTDNTSSVFTSLLEQDAVGFDGSPYDFQMLVPENQAPGTTNFYFFVELS